MYIMNIKDFSNHSINFIFLLLINKFYVQSAPEV